MDGTRRLHLRLDAAPMSVGAARRAVQTLLGDEAPIALLRDAMLLTSELVSSSVVHSADGCDVYAAFDDTQQHLRVEIADSSPALPQSAQTNTAQTNTAQTNTGRVGGLALDVVDNVATAWGSNASPTGHTMWFELGPRTHGIG